MSSIQQLYRIAPKGFQLPSIVESEGRIVSIDAEGMPLFRWPNGRWCFPVNSFMFSLLRKNKARDSRGGTLGTYAAYLSHLVRFCSLRKTDFHELTDSLFTEFMTALHSEHRIDDSTALIREPNTTRAIGNVCLNFLSHISTLYSLPNFIGESGVIRAYQKSSSFGKYTVTTWHHSSFPLRSNPRRRSPISARQIERLQSSATDISTSSFQKHRRFLMLRLLEITGGRRSEVALLTVASVRAAAKMAKPALSLITRKRKDNLYRLVPITRHDVRLLLEFIDRPRQKVIKTTCGVSKDSGFVLINSRTGQGLRPNTITQEIYELARAGNMEEQTCAHMFRHRFVTKLFVALIEQHCFETEDAFRKALISTETFKQEVLEWTGHKSTESLDTYIHLAFSEFSGLSRTVDKVHLLNSTESIDRSLSSLQSELLAGMDPHDALARMREIVSDLRSDLHSH